MVRHNCSGTGRPSAGHAAACTTRGFTGDSTHGRHQRFSRLTDRTGRATSSPSGIHCSRPKSCMRWRWHSISCRKNSGNMAGAVVSRARRRFWNFTALTLRGRSRGEVEERLSSRDLIIPSMKHFSHDADWMSNVVLMAKMVYVWLDQLSRTHGYPDHPPRPGAGRRTRPPGSLGFYRTLADRSVGAFARLATHQTDLRQPGGHRLGLFTLRLRSGRRSGRLGSAGKPAGTCRPPWYPPGQRHGARITPASIRAG